jgi:hypothetical protein
MDQHEKKKHHKKDLIDGRNEKHTYRNEENVEKNSSSIITSTFQRRHGRSNSSFGVGHEPGTMPGTGV